MDFLFIIVVLAFSFYRTLKNPFFPFVFLLFINALEFWARLRMPFFYNHKSILDIYFLFLVAFALLWFVLPSLKRGIKFNAMEVTVMTLILFSWVSLGWQMNGGYFTENSGVLTQTLISQIIYILLLPMLFQAFLDGKYSIKNDLMLVGLFIIPVIALMTDWSMDRGAEFKFDAVDAKTGEDVKSAYNPLQLGYFSGMMLLSSTVFFQKNAKYIAYALVAIPLSFYILFQSQSRGQLIVIIAILGFLTPALSPNFKIKRYLVILPVFLIVGLLAKMYFSDIMQTVFSGLGFSDEYLYRYSAEGMSDGLSDRGGRVDRALTKWQSSWLWMIGGMGMTNVTMSSGGYGQYLHNVSYEILFEQGLIGFAIYGTMLFLAFKAIYDLLSLETKTIEEHQMSLFFIGSFLFNFLLTFKQGSLYTEHVTWMSAILLFSQSYYLQKKYSDP